MLDINLFRNDLAAVAAGLGKRGVALDTARFESLEARRKDIQVRTQELQSRRNAASKQIGIAKGKGHRRKLDGLGTRAHDDGNVNAHRAPGACAWP